MLLCTPAGGAKKTALITPSSFKKLDQTFDTTAEVIEKEPSAIRESESLIDIASSDTEDDVVADFDQRRL